MRLRLDLAYDGGDFHGWAAQPGLRTVQAELESAARTVLRLPETTVTCAGRTDTGVHARGQVVHLDVPDDRARGLGPDDQRTLVRRLNGVLPPEVRVLACRTAAPGFDARFSAHWRRYCYRIADADTRPDPLLRHLVLSWPRALDPARMHSAASMLLGEHDFAAFCRRREGASTIRRLLQLECRREDSGELAVHVRADAFCHSMVRALVGCLIVVGEGRREPAWAAEVLAAGVRDPAVPVVPALGLVLEEVRYPPDDQLAARAEETRRVRSAG